jgi:hypothetical protein
MTESCLLLPASQKYRESQRITLGVGETAVVKAPKKVVAPPDADNQPLQPLKKAKLDDPATAVSAENSLWPQM